MVRYGGPRFEFFFTHQFLNNEQMIRKEDTQRVASIVRRREREAAQLERQRQCEESTAAAETGAETQTGAETGAGAGAGTAGTAASASNRRARREQRLCELSAPVLHGPALFGSGCAGRVIKPLAKGVPFPRGRDGGDYVPGVDRHRVVPRGTPRGRPPWLGRGVEWAAAEAAEREERRFRFGAPQRSAAEAQHTAQRVAGIARHHRAEPKAQPPEPPEGPDALEGPEGPEVEVENERERERDLMHSERPPSVFSHASSNGPIRALGTRHMETLTMKADVQQHLAQCGGLLTQPRQARRPPTPFDGMALPEITARLVRMQTRMDA